MGADAKEEFKEENNTRPLDDDDIIILKTYCVGSALAVDFDQDLQQKHGFDRTLWPGICGSLSRNRALLALIPRGALILCACVFCCCMSTINLSVYVTDSLKCTICS
ncbi:hypothetical protein Droror1_Dr00022107 [Drosera rotundifolia]